MNEQMHRNRTAGSENGLLSMSKTQNMNLVPGVDSGVQFWI
jgi:hypothetical protein